MWDGDYMGHPNDSLEKETKYAYFKNLDVTFQCWKCGKDFQGVEENQCTGIFGLTYCEHCKAAHEFGFDVYVCEFVEKYKQKAIYSGKDAREQLAEKDAEIARLSRALEALWELLSNIPLFELKDAVENLHYNDEDQRAKDRITLKIWNDSDTPDSFINRIAEVEDADTTPTDK